MGERLIKSKERVKNHGEVFTPKFIVHKMLNLEGVRDAKTDIYKTVLEPSAGEGVFLVELLKMRLDFLAKKYSDSFIDYENYSLIALTTLYGVELLKDNSQKCVANIVDVFMDYYRIQSEKSGEKINENVKKSAITIVSANNLLGNFLTEKDLYGNDLIFSEWKVLDKKRRGFSLIERTEYTLDEIREQKDVENGVIKSKQSCVQMSFFNEPVQEFEENYEIVTIDKVWKEKVTRS